MAFDAGIAFGLFVAASLFSLSLALLAGGARRFENRLLALFLLLVAGNFLGIALGLATGNPRWVQAAFFLLAIDPPTLLFFVLSHPYRRRDRSSLVVWSVVAILGAVSAVLVVAQPEKILSSRTPEHALLVAEVGAAYFAAWLFSIRGTVEAPTPRLLHRSVFVVRAVGVAAIPRVGLLPGDFANQPIYWVGERFGVPPVGTFGASLFEVAFVGALMLAAFALGLVASRGAGRPARAELGKAFRFVFIWVTLFALAHLLLDTAGRTHFRGGLLYGLRWIVFASILVHGVLAYQVVDFDRARARLAPHLGGLLGGLAFGLATAVILQASNSAPGVAAALSTAVGLAAAVPATAATRSALHRFEAASPASGSDRRLDLYRAALEAAWANGSPNAEARARLERDRRAFEVTHEEARTLEYVVAGAAGPRPVPLTPGEEVSPGVVVDRLLGEGAHGRVYLGVRQPSGERLVVKELRTEATEPGVVRRRLLREAKALRGLRHENVVGLLDVQVERARPLLFFEYVEARPLSERLAEGPLSVPETVEILREILSGLAAAHERGIVHGDIKPANILRGRTGKAWLTDFGLATFLEDAARRPATASQFDDLGRFEGTLAYMAPEQVTGRPIGAWTDLYQVGLVAFECLSGQRALALEGLSPLASLERVARPQFPLGTVPAPWRRMLGRALDRDPAARFTSAAEMRKALETVRSARRPTRRRR